MNFCRVAYLYSTLLATMIALGCPCTAVAQACGSDARNRSRACDVAQALSEESLMALLTDIFAAVNERVGSSCQVDEATKEAIVQAVAQAHHRVLQQARPTFNAVATSARPARPHKRGSSAHSADEADDEQSCYLACYSATGRAEHRQADGSFLVGLVRVAGAYDEDGTCWPKGGSPNSTARADHTGETAAMCAPHFGKQDESDRLFWTYGDTEQFVAEAGGQPAVSFEPARPGDTFSLEGRDGISPWPCVR